MGKYRIELRMPTMVTVTPAIEQWEKTCDKSFLGLFVFNPIFATSILGVPTRAKNSLSGAFSAVLTKRGPLPTSVENVTGWVRSTGNSRTTFTDTPFFPAYLRVTVHSHFGNVQQRLFSPTCGTGAMATSNCLYLPAS